MAVCSFAHREAVLSLQAAYSDYQIGAFENFHQPVEDTLMVLWPGPKVVFQYELRFVNRLRSQLLIIHLFLPIKQMPPGREEARNQAAFWKYPHFFELSDQFLFQCEKPSAHDRGAQKPDLLSNAEGGLLTNQNCIRSLAKVIGPAKYFFAPST